MSERVTPWREEQFECGFHSPNKIEGAGAAFYLAVKDFLPVGSEVLQGERKKIAEARKQFVEGSIPKEQLLTVSARVNEMLGIPQRVFLTDSLDILRYVLHAVRPNWSIINEACEHEERHVQVFQSFKPENLYEPIPEIAFGMYLPDCTNDGHQMPKTLAFYGVTIPGCSLIASIRRDPDCLFRAWKPETIRDFLIYIRENTSVEDRSEGDKILLGREFKKLPISQF